MKPLPLFIYVEIESLDLYPSLFLFFNQNKLLVYLFQFLAIAADY